MKRERIAPPYKAYLVSADGSKTPVDAHGIIIELGPGLELDLDLAPHPNHSGGLVICAGPRQSITELKKSSLCSTLAVRPGASNVIHVFVERCPRYPIVGDDQSEDAERGVAPDCGGVK